MTGTDGDSHELGRVCDVDSCDERVVSLDDGWEYERGIVCSSCIDYRQRHNHWPDEDAECCRECIIDEGGTVHDCSEASIDVMLRPGDECPNCGFELAATDGGVEPGQEVRVKPESNSPRAGDEGVVDEVNGQHVVVEFDDGVRMGHAVAELEAIGVARADGGQSTGGTEQWDLYECQNCGDTFSGRSQSAAESYECFACGSSAGCFERVERDIYAETEQPDEASTGGGRDA